MWNLEFDNKGKKSFLKLEKIIQTKILIYLEKRILPLANPRSIGKPLTANKKGLWRYRVADYRIICDIRDEEIEILVIDVDHRKDVYDK